MTFDIHNEYIAKDLIGQGFTLASATDGLWVLNKPEEISNTKARKIVSVCIKLFGAAKNLSRAKINYLHLIKEINQLNSTR